MECALKHVEIQMGNLLLAMGDDPLSPEVRYLLTVKVQTLLVFIV